MIVDSNRRRFVLAAAVALGAALAAMTTARAAPASSVSVVMVSIDGLRPDYVLEADRHGLRIPNLRRLLREGAHASGVAGVLPTVTYPSHTTLVTGVSPLRHHILGNTPFDPMGRNLDGWYWYAEDIKATTLWDAAARAGMPTASVDWPATAGARITWNIPQYWRAKTPDDMKLHRLLATPGLLAEAETALGRTYPPSYGWTVEHDVGRAAFNVFLLERRRPRLHLAYFTGFDEEQHQGGPYTRASLAVLEQIDALVGRLRDAAQRSGPTVFAVVSDHGFNRTDKEVHLGEALRAEGLILLDGRGRVTSWRAAVWSQGGSAAIVLNDPTDAESRRAVERVLDRLRQQPDSGIARVLTSDEARAMGGFPEAAFVIGLAPEFRMGGSFEPPVVRTGSVRGTHGMLPDDRNMDAAFFVTGPGIPAGRALGRIDMRDVAPTLAARLGLELDGAEGRDVLR